MTERWWDDEEEKTTKQTVEDLMNEAEITTLYILEKMIYIIESDASKYTLSSQPLLTIRSSPNSGIGHIFA